MRYIVIALVAIILLLSAVEIHDGWHGRENLVIFLVSCLLVSLAAVYIIRLLERKYQTKELIFSGLDRKRKINLKVLKWVFLAVYLTVLFGVFAVAYHSTLPDWLCIFYTFHDKGVILVVFGFILTQLFFVFVSGKIDVQRPMPRWKLIFPVCIAAVLLALLFVGMLCTVGDALDDVFPGLGKNLPPSTGHRTLLGILIANWIFWAVYLFFKYKSEKHLKVTSGLVTHLLSGSLLTLMLAIPAHIYVKRNSGCFVGMGTALGVSIGIVVALWAFGPGLILLFLEEVKKRRKK